MSEHPQAPDAAWSCASLDEHACTKAVLTIDAEDGLWLQCAADGVGRMPWIPAADAIRLAGVILERLS
jgi:hypothetical protein